MIYTYSPGQVLPAGDSATASHPPSWGRGIEGRNRCAAPRLPTPRNIYFVLHHRSHNFHLILGLDCVYIPPGVGTCRCLIDQISRTCQCLIDQQALTLPPGAGTSVSGRYFPQASPWPWSSHPSPSQSGPASVRFSIIFNHFQSFSIILNHFESFWIIFDHFPSFSIIFHHFSSFSEVPHRCVRLSLDCPQSFFNRWRVLTDDVF